MYTKKNGRMTYKTNRQHNFKRNHNYSSSKGRNKGNVTQQYNKYLKLAKDTFSAGDRIQAEYYYQFTDHYYRLMQELGINLDDQDNLLESRDANSENIVSENEKEKLFLAWMRHSFMGVKEDNLLQLTQFTEDIAKMARFLASDDAGFVTGDVINCSGGQS